MKLSSTHKMLPLALFVCVVGCKDFDKPRDLVDKPRPYLPDFDVEEQAKLIRGRFSIPDDDRAVGPRTGLDRSTPVGW